MRCLRLLLLLCLMPSAFFAATPTLVRDLNPRLISDQDPSPWPAQLTAVGSRTVFIVRADSSSEQAEELWVSDGTAAGTGPLRSFAPGYGFVNLIGSTGRIAFFTAASPEGPSLWRTDGTAEGTILLTRLQSISYSTLPATIQGDLLFFPASTTEQGAELWRSDGTVAGTWRLRDIVPGAYGSDPRELTPLGGLVYFFANDPTGPSLWVSDGTRQGTRRVLTLPPFSLPHTLTATGRRLFFLDGQGPLHGDLWTSDGTAAGTRTVPPLDRSRRGGIAALNVLGNLGSQLVFVAVDPVAGRQIWKSDGTAKGTQRLVAMPGNVEDGSLLIRQATARLGDRLFFIGPGGRLWSTRGTRASTQPLAGCRGGCPRVEINYWPYPGLLVQNGRLYFPGHREGRRNDIEPWVTDGTGAGTLLLGNFSPGEYGSIPHFFPGLDGETLFIVATQGRAELWSTDGTVAGSRFLSASAAFPTDHQNAGSIVARAGGRAVFAGWNPERGAEIWSTDGTEEGTRLLTWLADGAGSNPYALTAFEGDLLFFACFDPEQPAGLWFSDGTAAGTQPIAPQCAPGETPRMQRLGDATFFMAIQPGEYWHEVWRTDGTPAGTYPIHEGSPTESVWSFRTAGDRLFFTMGVSDEFLTSLWVSDGTPEGTRKIVEVPIRYAILEGAFENEVFFTGQDIEYGQALWRSDGTPEGTRALQRPLGTLSNFTRLGEEVFFLLESCCIWKTDGTRVGTRGVLPAALSPYYLNDISGMTRFGDALYIMARNGLPTYETPPALFRSDGTAAGTAPIQTFKQDESGILPRPQFTPAGRFLFFVAGDPEHGHELWRTDGTPAGTVLVRDIAPGLRSSGIASLTAAGETLYFTADDGEHGVELWTSDGTAQGTKLVADLLAGPLSSSPRDLTWVPARDGGPGRLFFSADDGVVGRELWVLPLASDH